jgi:hypothetical protein
MPTIAVSTFSFGPECMAREGLDFAQYLDVLKPFPFTLAMESRDESDPEGCVLRSRDALKRVLQDAAR